jgi:hypothetical protein
MTLEYQAAPVRKSKAMVWAGRVLSALPVLLLLFSAAMKLMRVPAAVEGFAKYGYPAGAVLGLGVVELACTLLYVFPGTAVLGAILLTGYLGGATATHLRAGEAYFMPIVLGVVLWLGLFLRDARLRALLPWRKSLTPAAGTRPAE